jgi:peptidoglycan/xylan/chitin deacetylase (PgdA/CDA1 family)
LTAAYSITFDNLGEVLELQRGQLPEDAPLGRHFSVTRALPRILDLLEEVGVRATFFVEGLNTELYPETLRRIAAAGHELAYHGWCHEEWARLERDEEARLLERGVRALEELGLRPAGFRPPGGRLTASSLELLRELGFAYCSPEGGDARVEQGVAILPFAWSMVDAYHYLPRFAALRGASDPLSPAAFGELLDAAVGSQRCVVFHPFLADDDERFAVLRRHVEAVARSGVRCAPLRELAAAA